MQHFRRPAVNGSLMAVAALLGSFLASPNARAALVTVPGFSYVKSLEGIDEYTLDANGLQVLLKPDHSAPVVTFGVAYHVGSRNEVTGSTGSTHLLEHLMFKGSWHFNGEIGKEITFRVRHPHGAEDRHPDAFVDLDAGHQGVESDRFLRQADDDLSFGLVGRR